MAESKPIHILLAEDHEDTLHLMTLFLRRSGYIVHAAKTATEAESLAATKHCDLLVSDLGLPDERGETLMQKLRSNYKLKGIAVSGHAYASEIEAARKAGFDKFFVKPLHLPDLLGAIRELACESH